MLEPDLAAERERKSSQQRAEHRGPAKLLKADARQSCRGGQGAATARVRRREGERRTCCPRGSQLVLTSGQGAEGSLTFPP